MQFDPLLLLDEFTHDALRNRSQLQVIHPTAGDDFVD
jgi:hypothetical protein